MTLAEVSAACLASRGGRHGSWPWSEKLLAAADRQFAGNWRETTVDAAALLDVMLPSHAGEPCKGDQLTLVGTSGASVREAAATFARVERAYELNNESCFSRISLAADQPFSAIVLGTAPLDADDYRTVTPRPGALYCIDGFHRLVAWAWRRRLESGQLPVFVAGEFIS
jgi:hypothetical protein